MSSPVDRRRRLWLARLYLVCEAWPARREAEDLLYGALEGGVDIVQLRQKDGRDEEIMAAAEIFRRCCDDHGALFVINDRPDLARAAGADGVHLGQGDASVAEGREIGGPDLLIGVSTHTPEQVDAAGRSGADYIAVGPVHATPTKPGRPAVGLGLVEYAAAHVRIPFFAIGGIDARGVGAVQAAGGRRVAVVRATAEAEDPRAAAQALRRALEGTQEARLGAP